MTRSQYNEAMEICGEIMAHVSFDLLVWYFVTIADTTAEVLLS